MPVIDDPYWQKSAKPPGLQSVTNQANSNWLKKDRNKYLFPVI